MSGRDVRFLTLGALVVAAVLVVGERAWHTHAWAGDVNQRADAGLASFRFLAAPAVDPATGKPLRAADGKSVTNADVLGVLINERVARRSDAPAGARPADR